MIKSALAVDTPINNPALSGIVKNLTPGEGLAFYIATLWRAAVTVGGLMVILYIVWGGVEWLMAAGDKAKLESAQHKITNSILGLAVLVASYAIVKFIEAVFKINLLQPVFESNL